MNSCLPGQVGKELYLPRHTNPLLLFTVDVQGRQLQRGKNEGGSALIHLKSTRENLNFVRTLMTKVS